MVESKRKIGRPRRAALPQTQIVVYLDIPTMEAMDQAADKAAMSRSEWIREAIREKLEREQSHQEK
ncbi:MAG: ribbon-helix-helix domain-containing protein [Moorellaceae bacterium]